MNQQKKNSPLAQASSELNMEAAIKLLHPLSSTKPLKDNTPMDGDGDDGDGPEVLSFLIEVAMNGFMVTVTYVDDTPDLRVVVQTMDEVVEALRGHF